MKKKATNQKFFKYLIIFLLLIIFSLASFIAGIFIGEKHSIKKEEKDKTIASLQQKIKELKKESILDKKIKETKNYENSEIIDYENAQKIIPPPKIEEKPKKITKIYTTKPKLVIIIDDVAFKYEVNALKKLPYKITPSFFPPTSIHPNTPQLAKEFSHYMVHMPMEALHYPRPEPNTLNVNSSYEFIEKRIETIKKLFPNVKFINNHTGSKFTSNYNAMYKLFTALKKNNIGFIDSKTTPYSKAEKVNKIFKIPMYSRNIFLDNIQNEKYIQNQLKKAIKLAKKYGYAIAIGHPHKATIKALKDSKKLLSQVEVVYIDELKN